MGVQARKVLAGLGCAGAALLAPVPAWALPGQTPAAVAAEARAYGWQTGRPSDTVFSGKVEGSPLKGSANGWVRGEVGKDGRVATETLHLEVDAGFVGNQVEQADALWRRFVRDFYPELAAQILDAPPEATRVAKTRSGGEIELHRIVVTAGKDLAFDVEAREAFTNGTFTTYRPGRSLTYELSIVPRARLAERVGRLEHYNLQLLGPAVIGSAATDLPAIPAEVRRAHLAPPPTAAPVVRAPGIQGIGIRIGASLTALRVLAVLPGGPADHAGLQAQDQILSIDGHPTDAMSEAEAVAAIRGQAGTKVVLEIARAGEANRKLEIPRGEIRAW